MITTTRGSKRDKRKMFRLSRVNPKVESDVDMDSVRAMYHQYGNRKAFDILMEAQHYWNNMGSYRKERERNKRYCYGDQWGDMIKVDGKWMREDEYIRLQGNVPLKNNLIRRLVRNVIGVYRGQSKEPTCIARDRDEQELGETMSTILQYNMQKNREGELNARTMEEFLLGSFIVHRKSFGWRNGEEDCWTDFVPPNDFFIDNNMRDFRGWDVSCLGEIHDISFGQLVQQFSRSPEEYRRLKEIYKYASNRDYISSFAAEFGYSRLENYDFLFTSEPGRCRVIEVWRKEQKPRYRCHDYLNGDIYKIDEEDYVSEVESVNAERLEMGRESGIPEEDVPLVQAEWFIDDYWYYYFLSPFGDVLREGETPYEHGSHPYVFKAYPFIDGEIHSFVSDFIDQQRYVNRLVMLNDWVIRSTSKGVLMIPEDSIPDGVSIEEIADEWSSVNGIVVYKPSKSGKIPEQMVTNSTNIGISELLNLQLKFFEDISGVNGALQGKPGYSGTSAALYSQQTQNSTTSLLDILEAFSSFIRDAAYKNVKNIQQFYDEKRIFNISGNVVEYDPQKLRNVEFDLSIVESTTTPAFRLAANDMLMELFKMQAISVEQLLEFGHFAFGDKLLQSIRSQKEQIEQGKNPDGLSPELQQQVAQQAQQANPQAMEQLQQYMGAA